jgi:hypothetical protein
LFFLKKGNLKKKLNKKYLLYFLFIILLSLSGCIELIGTQEKQACLSLTHFSENSIDECNTQANCYGQVEKINFYESENLPFEIYNGLSSYKNHVASIYFNYTKTKKLLEKINNACLTDKPKEIIDNVNLLRFYFSESFRFLDKTSKESIKIIKDYTLFLELQQVNLIPEEKIFQDYIVLNQNLNDLKENKNENTYVYKLFKDIDFLNKYAKQIGFKENYVSKENLNDLTVYYLKYYDKEVNAHEVYVPEIFGMGYFLLNKMSSIEDIRQINEVLNKLEGYNYYLIIDKFVGKNNSVVTNFKELNNSINSNLDGVYEKIKDHQLEIENEKEYLKTDEYLQFLKYKHYFFQQEITFGFYLSYLKNIKIIIEKNKLLSEDINKQQEEIIFDCDLVVETAKKYSNYFFKEKIKEYEKTNNFLEKERICKDLKSSLENKDCFEKINAFLEKNILEGDDYQLFVYQDQDQCLEVLNNINYKLKENEKIKLLNKLILENLIKKQEIELFIIDNSNINKLLDISIQIKNIENLENIEKIINVDEKIKNMQEINDLLDQIAKEVIDFKKCVIIENKDNTYLKINNPFSFFLENISINHNYSGIKSVDNKIIVKGNSFEIEKLFSGDNLFEIEYENKNKITYNIIYLSLTESLIEIVIENEIENIKNTINFLPNFISMSHDCLIIDDKVEFITKKENKCYLKGDLFQINKEVNISNITEEKIIIYEKFILKNNYFDKINQKLTVTDKKEDSLVQIFINDKEVDQIIEDDKIKIILTLNTNEFAKIIVQTLENKKEINTQVRMKLLLLNKFLYLPYQDLVKEINKDFKNIIEMKIKEEYSLDEIKLVLGKINLFDSYEKQLEVYEFSELNYYKTYNSIDFEKITEKEKKSIDKIDVDKYKNIILAETELIKIFSEIQNREKQDLEFKSIENLETISVQKEIIQNYSLENIDVDKLLKTKSFDEIDQIIINKLKEKAEDLYLKVNPNYNQLDIYQIQEIISKVYLLFEEYTLRDLYNVKYFSGISENDAKRLEKSSSFLDSVALNKELSRHEEYFENQEYQKAIDVISQETINRIDKIKSDYAVLKNGLEIIKNDAKKEIIQYQSKEIDNERLELAKSYYDEEKFLTTIMLLKTNEKENIKNNKFKQILISLGIVILFGVLYTYIRLGNKPKKEDFEIKKKKIIKNQD